MSRPSLLRAAVPAGSALAGWLLPAVSIVLLGSAARASLIGDEVGGELITFPGFTFDQATAMVGPGVEFSRTFVISADPDPFVELDVGASSFTFTFTNPLDTGCPALNPTCLYNLGLLGLELTGLDWVDTPGAEIVDVVQSSSTFPAGSITGVSFGPDSISVEFSQPVIPGFGTVWSASWDIVVVPEPGAVLLLGAGLAGLAVARHRRPSGR